MREHTTSVDFIHVKKDSTKPHSVTPVWTVFFSVTDPHTEATGRVTPHF